MSRFKFPASLSQGNGLETITAFNAEAEDPVFVANSTHPRFKEIVSGLENGDPNVWELFDVAGGVMRRMHQVTDRVSWNGSEVLFDGDPIHTVLADQLGRVIESGNTDNYVALAKFWEKLESNPEPHSREQAYEFLAAHQFQITKDGDVVGYKGVSSDEGQGYLSSFSSSVEGKPSGYVNGNPVPQRSRIPQRVGDVVTMPRSEVAHDPSVACSRGLHVATRNYAQGYGNVVLEVHVNPMDIVSVPNDARGEKVRVCRYKVARVSQNNEDVTGPVLEQSGEDVWVGGVGYEPY